MSPFRKYLLTLKILSLQKEKYKLQRIIDNPSEQLFIKNIVKDELNSWANKWTDFVESLNETEKQALKIFKYE